MELESRNNFQIGLSLSVDSHADRAEPSIEIRDSREEKNRYSQSQSNINYDSIVNRRPLTRLIAFSCAMPYA